MNLKMELLRWFEFFVVDLSIIMSGLYFGTTLSNACCPVQGPKLKTAYYPCVYPFRGTSQWKGLRQHPNLKHANDDDDNNT